MRVVRAVPLVALVVIAFASGVQQSGDAAAATGSAPANNHITPGRKPAGATTAPTQTASPTPTPTPAGRTPLSEPDEYHYELVREQDALNTAYAAGVARFAGSLIWPIVCIVALLAAADLARRWLANRAVPDAPAANAVVARAVSANAQFSVPAADLARVNAAAQLLAAQFQALMPQAPPSPIAMLSMPVPAGAPVPLVDARSEVEQYADRVFRVMVSSQYGLLVLAASRVLTYGEATSIYADAQSSGYSAAMTTWLDVLVRTGLLRSVAAGAPVNTAIMTTTLGRMFLGWCDAQGYSKAAFARLGRGV
jgi:hypothetical protein